MYHIFVLFNYMIHPTDTQGTLGQFEGGALGHFQVQGKLPTEGSYC